MMRLAPCSKVSLVCAPVLPASRAARGDVYPVVLAQTPGCFRPLRPNLHLLAAALPEYLLPG